MVSDAAAAALQFNRLHSLVAKCGGARPASADARRWHHLVSSGCLADIDKDAMGAKSKTRDLTSFESFSSVSRVQVLG